MFLETVLNTAPMKPSILSECKTSLLSAIHSLRILKLYKTTAVIPYWQAEKLPQLAAFVYAG